MVMWQQGQNHFYLSSPALCRSLKIVWSNVSRNNQHTNTINLQGLPKMRLREILGLWCPLLHQSWTRPRKQEFLGPTFFFLSDIERKKLFSFFIKIGLMVAITVAKRQFILLFLEGFCYSLFFVTPFTSDEASVQFWRYTLSVKYRGDSLNKSLDQLLFSK